MPPIWVHFYGVGVSALAATVARSRADVVGARRGDARTVLVGGGFTVMAALLAVHGLVDAGHLVGNNGVIAVTGAATLRSAAACSRSRAAAVRSAARDPASCSRSQALARRRDRRPQRRRRARSRSSCPACPRRARRPASALFASGSSLYGALAVRAHEHVPADAPRRRPRGRGRHRCSSRASLYGALIAHVHGARLVARPRLRARRHRSSSARSVAYDLRRGRPVARRSSATCARAELVAAEEAFLGARVRALMVRLAAKDSVDRGAHAPRRDARRRRSASSSASPPARLRSLAIGGLLHDIGKLSCPTRSCRSRARSTTTSTTSIKRHPEHGRELLGELGGFDEQRRRGWCSTTTSGSTAAATRAAWAAPSSTSTTRILAVCDVYDALVSPRVYRAAWTPERALALLREETGTAFDAAALRRSFTSCRPRLGRNRGPPVPTTTTGRRLTPVAR